MRNLTPKRAKQARDWSKARAEFIEEFGFCMNPDCKCGRFLSCHEIAKGPHRPLAFESRSCWLVLCVTCNCQDFCDYSVWPLSRQLALKWIYDREYFDLEGFNRLRGRAPNAISFCEVVLHVCRLLDGGVT